MTDTSSGGNGIGVELPVRFGTAVLFAFAGDCLSKMFRSKVCGGDSSSRFHAGACGVGLGKNLTEDNSCSVR